MADREKVAHLLRRATFGPTAEEVDAAESRGLAATIDALFEPAGTDSGAARTPPPKLGPVVNEKSDRAEQIRTVGSWWLDRMVQADHQVHEKLTFFWHGHWATSADKVKSGPLMLAQQQTLFRTALGDFATQVHSMLRDPALIIWLDGQKNTNKAPNENLARELMELFTLGVGHYTEQDVREGARALTGWVVDQKSGTASLNPKRHDDRPKTILGQTGTYDADAFADLLLAQPACPDFVAKRLWLRYCSDADIPAATLSRARTQPTTAAVLRQLLTSEGHAELVKQPVEWLVGALRQLQIRPGDLPEAQRKQLGNGLTQLGQVPLRPPSVGGWPAGAAWLTTSATQARLKLAQSLAARAPQPVLDRLTASPPPQRPAALARLLVVDKFTDRTLAALTPAANDARQLLTLGLASPEYAIN
ncbi:DUF1800 domain-containing protein [Dactylosporangium matsuzakiense]|uniref:DUF1800 domain-containing protein n=1 Tax=Dactylosporangium matsuzakiense TaxID=53360 RepID=A0A9W6KGB9_9ACTN|nr:DUF1800 domain-containing protein [Dactylosporangium matsuzakiense]UWZ45621.1 DUF1800 domain-containing protein [Dactylosporangium matsuzakiense]GLL00367.1 hypothetical protein GCM10017581_021070 [Dactylosporangium matsuzakiense]